MKGNKLLSKQGFTMESVDFSLFELYLSGALSCYIQ